MAGHSKWANIQHRKGAQDKKRAKVFDKLGKEVQVAARLGGADPDMNPRLRLAIANAKSKSMPKDRIDNAIKKGAGIGEDAVDYVEMRYEGYGPGGVAVIVDALTENKNRTAGEVRASFTKYGGNMGETNSVSFMFDRVGQIVFEETAASADEMFEAAVEAGADDCVQEDGHHVVYCQPDSFAAVRDALEEKIGEPKDGGLIWKPQTLSDINEDQARSLLKMIDALEDNDDVQDVTTNFDVSDDIMEKLMA